MNRQYVISCFAQIEKEMLAIVFGLERFERYIYGHHIKVETDHKPPEVIHKKSPVSTKTQSENASKKAEI